LLLNFVQSIDISESGKEFAKAALSPEYLDELTSHGFLRKEIYQEKCIYFPTETYLKNCDLID
jgi:hypothetical protein